MQHSQPHMTLYCVEIFLSWGGIILRIVESLMMKIFSSSFAYLVPTSSGQLTMLLWSNWTEICNKMFGTICFFSEHQYTHKWNVLLLVISQPKDAVEYNHINLSCMWIYSCMYISIWNTWTRHMDCVDIFELWFSST